MKMKEQPGADDRAVAPVVGIALLIAITVILAGVIGSVIFGLSVDPSDSPQTTLSFSAEGDTTVELTHEGGQTLDADEIVIRYSGNELTLDSDLSAGERREIIDTEDGDPDFADADQISVVWQDPTSDTESVLATFNP